MTKTRSAGGVVTIHEGEVLMVSRHEGATPTSVLAATAAPSVRALVVGPAGTGLEHAHATLL